MLGADRIPEPSQNLSTQFQNNFRPWYRDTSSNTNIPTLLYMTGNPGSYRFYKVKVTLSGWKAQIFKLWVQATMNGPLKFIHPSHTIVLMKTQMFHWVVMTIAGKIIVTITTT